MPAGSISAPTITPLREPATNRLSYHIDSGTYIEIETDSPHCTIYFTTDGSKPNPFARRFSGREITFKYRAPFTLKPGSRTVKAIAVSKSGINESPIVSRTFVVEDLLRPITKHPEPPYDESDNESIDSDLTDINRRHEMKRESSPRKHAWKDDVPETAEPNPPFKPINHSGTQINLWGGHPGKFEAPNTLKMRTGDTTFASLPYSGTQPLALTQNPQNTLKQSQPDGVSKEELSQLANSLAQKIDQTGQMTMNEMRTLLKENESKAPQYRPPPAFSAFEPPLTNQSPGNGNIKLQAQHIYAHLLDLASRDPNFRAGLSSPEFGPIRNGDVSESPDSYTVTLEFAKPGASNRSYEPAKKPPPPQKKYDNMPPQPIWKPSSKVPSPAPLPDPPRKFVTPQEPPKPMEKPEEESKISAAKISEDKKAQAAPDLTLKKQDTLKPPEQVEESYFETEEYIQEGTLKPFADFNVEDDCQRLMKAMKGIGTDVDTLVLILGKRSISQRMMIKDRYKSKYGKDLISEIEGELKPSHNFKKTCKGLLYEPYEFDAWQLHTAIAGLGTDEECLIEIICTRTDEQLKKIKETYKSMFNKELEKDVEGDTSGDFRRLLVSLLQANRPESQRFDRAAAKADAQALYDAGIGKRFGTDESKFREILVTRGNAHLRATFDEYDKLSQKKTLEESIKDEMSGDFGHAILSVVRCVRHKPAYFAHTLVNAMSHIGKSEIVMRVVVSRCEVDMVQIKEAFQAEKGKPLGEVLSKYDDGDFGQCLLELCGDDSYLKKKK